MSDDLEVSTSTCGVCRGAGTVRGEGGEAAPCPYCRPEASRRHLDDYDPAEDSDSELVGNPLEEEDLRGEEVTFTMAWDDSLNEKRQRELQATYDVAFVLGLEAMSDEALATLLTHAKEGHTRELAQAEQDTRAVERAAIDAQRYLDAHEGGWAPPNVELPE